MSYAMLAVVVAECEHPVKQCQGSIEEKLRAAMNAAKNHWMVLDRDIQFRGAIGAVMIHYGKESDEYRRIETELAMLRKLTAIMAASEAGLSVALSEADMPPTDYKPLGLTKMWHEVLAKK